MEIDDDRRHSCVGAADEHCDMMGSVRHPTSARSEIRISQNSISAKLSFAVWWPGW